ncbi:hypothetical protein [Paenibacillus sp. N3.4]|nr:hypothetical protein [Paenibacillus sp. N3.4]
MNMNRLQGLAKPTIRKLVMILRPVIVSPKHDCHYIILIRAYI